MALDTAVRPREAFIRDMFGVVDNQDSATFLTYLTSDAVFSFGNMPPARGGPAIAQAFDGFCQSIKSLQHAYVRFFDQNDVWIVEQIVHYVDQWDRRHSLPCVNILRFADDKVADYRIFMDVSPLFIPPA